MNNDKPETPTQADARVAPSPPAGDLPRGCPPQEREGGRSGVLPERSWFMEPMVWLVIGIPFATVIAGISTVATAFNVGNVDSVIDPVKRTGKMQEFKMSGDREAARLGLLAEGQIDADTHALRLRLAGDLPTAATLKLTFAHPVRTSEDRTTVVVAHGATDFLGRAEIELDHDWNLILAPEDGSWRLVGRFEAHAERFQLMPALPAR
jgi:uncharacterized protein